MNYPTFKCYTLHNYRLIHYRHIMDVFRRHSRSLSVILTTSRVQNNRTHYSVCYTVFNRRGRIHISIERHRNIGAPTRHSLYNNNTNGNNNNILICIYKFIQRRTRRIVGIPSKCKSCSSPRALCSLSFVTYHMTVSLSSQVLRFAIGFAFRTSNFKIRLKR